MCIRDRFNAARNEELCTINDITAAAGYLLKFGGRLCLCSRPERLTDTICAMRGAGIEPKRMRLVVPVSYTHMYEDDGSPFTAHTTNLVPFVVVGYDCKLRDGGVLADIAPTILKIAGIEQPSQMTGKSIII